MPWMPELFSAPVPARFEPKRRPGVEIVPYFDGLVAGDVDALVASFAAEPRLHHPLRGHIEGEYEFREFVADTERWLHEHEATVEDVRRTVLERRGFEEVIVHLGGAKGPIDLPHAMVADHAGDGRIEEIRVYFSTRPLTGRPTERAPLLAGDPALRLPAPATALANGRAAAGVELEPCVLVEDGDICALEYNVHRPASEARIEAGLTVFVLGADGTLDTVRTYDDVDFAAAGEARNPRPARAEDEI